MVCSATGTHRRPGRGRCLQPAVQVVRGTGTLAGHHRRAEWVARRTERAECRTLMWLDLALQDLAAAADRGLLGRDVPDLEPVLRVVLAVPVRQPPAAL